jgi:hypothetical protein
MFNENGAGKLPVNLRCLHPDHISAHHITNIHDGGAEHLTDGAAYGGAHSI